MENTFSAGSAFLKRKTEADISPHKAYLHFPLQVETLLLQKEQNWI